MTKYDIPDTHVWADEKHPNSESENPPPAAEVTSHSVEILHRGHARTTGERDIRYRYLFENGEAIGILRSHRLAESNQFDPMSADRPPREDGWKAETEATFERIRNRGGQRIGQYLLNALAADGVTDSERIENRLWNWSSLMMKCVTSEMESVYRPTFENNAYVLLSR